jgi:hypothetical protein
LYVEARRQKMSGSLMVMRPLVLAICLATAAWSAVGPSGELKAQRASAAGDGIPSGGTVLFRESFDDARFGARDWYDSPRGTISTTEHAPASASAFECTFAPGARVCTGGTPARHAIRASETVYVSFWLKFSENWIGSGRAYHPHMIQLIDDLDDAFVGPARTFLTTYIEVVGERGVLGLQDSKNVDLRCIIRNDDTFAGCDGNSSTFPFTERRSVASCNGLAGDVAGRDCFPVGDGSWYSARTWSAPGAFVATPGQNHQAAWHFVEVFFALNSIRNGQGAPDGRIRWIQDGRVLIASDRILFRTGDHPALRLNQFALLPYIGDGSPIAQSFWIDDLIVATARP